MMKSYQHQHKGKGKLHTHEKSQDAMTFRKDTITNTVYTPVKLRLHVYVPEDPGELHAQEAKDCHQEGGEPHQVPAR
jgi:hypothetical protein